MNRVSIAADSMPGITGRIEFTTNSLGVRGREVDLDSVDTRILCVGGSTTHCLYVSDKDSWPWRLETQLASRLDQSVFVGNAGRSGLFSSNYEFLIDNYTWTGKYQWVVIFCGFNDLMLSLDARYEERISNIALTTFRSTPRVHSRLYYNRSHLAQLIVRVLRPHIPEGIRLDEKGGHYVGRRKLRQESMARGARSEPPVGFEQKLEQYRRNLKNLINTCRRKRIKVVFMTQPTMYRADLPEELERLLWLPPAEPMYETAVLGRMMDDFNQILLEVCKQEQVDCIDLASMMPKDTNSFYDDCHLNISGCQKVADILTEFFDKKLTAPQ